MIFMKTNELDRLFQDVDEKKGVNQKAVAKAQSDAEMQDKSSDAGEVPGSRRRGKVARGASRGKKMLRNDDRSRYVHENKQKCDNFTEAKSDIYVHMTDV